MGYGYIRIDINESGDHEIRTTINGTLRMDTLQEDAYLAWVSGAIKPFFRTEVTQEILVIITHRTFTPILYHGTTLIGTPIAQLVLK